MATTRTSERPARTSSTKENRRRGSENRSSLTSNRLAAVTVPGLELDDAASLVTQLQASLVAYLDLAMTLKHIHWNVVGPSFMAVHEMLDPQFAGVQRMIDATAERIATLGGSANGLPGNLVTARTWDDYELARADAIGHLAALDLVYSGVIASARESLTTIDELDPITADLVTGQIGELEQYQWFVRAHLEDGAGGMRHAGEKTEVGAAAKSMRRTGRR